MTGVGLAMNTSRTYAFMVFFIMIACGLIFFSGSGLQAKSSETAVPTKGDPIRIGILMPQAGALAEVAGVQAEGIKMAHEMEKGKVGRQVDLIFKDAGTSFQDFSQALKDLLMQDKVSGVISCVSADMIAKAFYVMKQRAVPFIATTSAGLDWKTKEGGTVIRMGTSLEDQAYACSRFMVNVLHASRIALVVDVQDESCVRLASLFSSYIVKTNGIIVDIAYIKKGEDPSPGITHLMEGKPDAVYIPFSGSNTHAALFKARSLDAARPILVSNIHPEETFLREVDKSLEGLYIQSDFIEETVKSPSGKEFIEFFHKHAQKRTYLGSSTATGADSYFLMLDMVSRQQKAMPDETSSTDPSWRPLLLGITLSKPGGTVQKHLCFGRIKRDFLGDAVVKYVASVAFSGSDPVAHIRAQ